LGVEKVMVPRQCEPAVNIDLCAVDADRSLINAPELKG
jgi:hypothetical protein